MEPVGSLPCSQDSATVHCPGPDESNQRLNFSNGRFPPGSATKRLHAFLISHFSHACCMFRPPNLPRHNHLSNIC